MLRHIAAAALAASLCSCTLLQRPDQVVVHTIRSRPAAGAPAAGDGAWEASVNAVARVAEVWLARSSPPAAAVLVARSLVDLATLGGAFGTEVVRAAGRCELSATRTVAPRSYRVVPTTTPDGRPAVTVEPCR